MHNLTSVFIFTLLVVGGICESTGTTHPTTESSSTTQSSVDTTTLSTTKADTTTLTTLSTTKADTTTLPTTSSSASTSSQAPTTSSPVPTTTSSIKPTPSPVPSTTTEQSTTNVPISTTSVPPSPEDTFWNVTDGNITCIRAELKIRFKIPVKDQFDYIILSQGANSEKSTCNATNGTQELSLVDSDYNINIIFEKDSSAPKAFVKEISFSYSLPPNIQGDVSNNSRLFEVNVGNSYLCNTGNVDLQNITMEIMHIKIQAFQGEGNKDFGTIEECEADNKVNDLIPIVVGCALLALVVIVLIAYFVGRRRSRQKGYQSV